jgi:hypothetical protein
MDVTKGRNDVTKGCSEGRNDVTNGCNDLFRFLRLYDCRTLPQKRSFF